MDLDVVSLVGTLAAICSTSSFVPQAWRIVRTRDTTAISKRMYVVTVAGFALWTTYGILGRQWPLILPNAICLLCSGFILAMKLMPRRGVDAVAATLTPHDTRPGR